MRDIKKSIKKSTKKSITPGAAVLRTVRRPLPSEEPEPSCVYGYISLVDPRTGEKHLIKNHDHASPRVIGFPDLDVVFRAVSGEHRRRVQFRAGRGLQRAGIDPDDPNGVVVCSTGAPLASQIAYLYYFPLVQDRSAGSPRYVEDTTRHHAIVDPRHTIRYNPDQWRFETVETGPQGYTFQDPDGSLGGPDAMRIQRGSVWYSGIPLTRRAEPFPDLPDIS